ncbi:antibiotic biosynthesis monooxygenase [Pseudomonas syringae KCTC 12500]|nr:antibiotic biosynthesis monooxygenase [Pseudomonas syringae KCTC 12500]POR87860.1 antibiotic biosynthesis monooxygenase [Pseudomonas syringae pv. syringae]
MMMKMELFDAQSVTDDNAVYLINVVQVNEGAQDLAIQILEETVSYVARTYSAFKWSRLMRSIDGKTVINQAQWSDRSQFESLFTDAEFLLRYSRLKETGTWEYHLYNVAEYITPEIAFRRPAEPLPAEEGGAQAAFV